MTSDRAGESALWLASLQAIADLGAHEIKDALNGVTLNLEVIRSRASASQVPGAASPETAPFAMAAAEQLEILGARVEALLALSRPPRGSGNVGITLKHLAALMVPAARANGGSLQVTGLDHAASTSASAAATRLALGGSMLELVRLGGGSCELEARKEASAAVVRFSHESAGVFSLSADIGAALADEHIRIERSGSDLLVVFPGP